MYITCGVVEPANAFRMFGRAKVWFDAVPHEVMQAASERALLVGRLGLTDDNGWPLCAAVRPPRIHWASLKPHPSHAL